MILLNSMVLLHTKLDVDWASVMKQYKGLHTTIMHYVLICNQSESNNTSIQEHNLAT